MTGQPAGDNGINSEEYKWDGEVVKSERKTRKSKRIARQEDASMTEKGGVQCDELKLLMRLLFRNLVPSVSLIAILNFTHSTSQDVQPARRLCRPHLFPTKSSFSLFNHTALFYIHTHPRPRQVPFLISSVVADRLEREQEIRGLMDSSTPSRFAIAGSSDLHESCGSERIPAPLSDGNNRSEAQ